MRSLLDAFDVPYRIAPVLKSSHDALPSRTGIGAYALAADLRRLLNDAFSPTWGNVSTNIETLISASERAIAIATPVQERDTQPDEFARAAARTQLIPGAGLMAIAQAWPTEPHRLALYLEHSLVRGASRAAFPTVLATAIVDEISCRPAWRAVYDSVICWVEGWIVCASLDRLRADPQPMLRQIRMQLRIGIAMRAMESKIAAPRFLALLELTSVAVFVREAGRADLIRAYEEADGDASGTVRQHVRHDHDGSVIVDVAIGEALRPLDPAMIAELHEVERHALSYFDEVLAADPVLRSGLLSDPPALQSDV
jgi:hypothetical protein